MQEIERRKIIEEQETALDHVRWEEHERQIRISQEEDRQQKLEDEACEAARRVDSERLEAIMKGEELKIAREEEKRRLQLEEERRKQAAKHKLLELEAKMARRQTLITKDEALVSNLVVDEKLETTMKEKEISRDLKLDAWKERERMVQKVSTPPPFDSFAPGTHVDMGSRSYSLRECSSIFVDSGKAINSWRRAVLEDGVNFHSSPLNHEIGHYIPRRYALGGGGEIPRKEFHAGPKDMSYFDECGYEKDHRWNIPQDGNSQGKSKEMDSDFPDSIAHKYCDYDWSDEHSQVSPHSHFPERLYPDPESNEHYSYGRSRYSTRHHRSLPPPFASAQRSNVRESTKQSDVAYFLHNDNSYMHNSKIDTTEKITYYGDNQEWITSCDVIPVQETTTIENQKFNTTPRCDSPSSLYVSSPPTSPPHLSNDEFDESGDSCMTSVVEIVYKVY